MFLAFRPSTAICSTMDKTSQPSSSTSSSSSAAASATRLGGRAIDRHNPIIRDGRRFTPPPSPSLKPSSHQHYQTQKTKLGLASSGNCEKSKEQNRTKKNKKSYGKGKKASDGDGGKSPAGGLINTPPGSSRYLLGDPVFFDGLVDSDPVPVPPDPDDDPEKITPVLDYNEDRLIINASKVLSCSSSSFLEKKQPDFFEGFLDYDPVLSPDNPIYEPNRNSPTQSSREDKHVATPNVESSSRCSSFSDKKPSSDQVVVLRVSLHCKGCAGKVRKHLSKMRGVTSFNIDFAAKKVTVTGDVTPLGVLASISKVKNAQFWPEIKK